MNLQIARRVIQVEIERLIGVLDAMDGDPDLEPDADDEDSHDAEGMDDDSEPDVDDEPEDADIFNGVENV